MCGCCSWPVLHQWARSEKPHSPDDVRALRRMGKAAKHRPEYVSEPCLLASEQITEYPRVMELPRSAPTHLELMQ